MGTALVDRLLLRDPRAVARALSIVENAGLEATSLLSQIHPYTGHAYLVGVTGPPGAGKSTLVDRLIVEFRRAGQRVGVLAVDPTSPFSGGALLGDRVRMQTHASDPDVFIRSMATRGALGGLAGATSDAASILDAAGFDLILIETVGVGQDEIDIVRTADVAIVVLVPGAGDDVQALKAGIMEIGDVFVVNKADRDGADRTAASVEGALSLGDQRGRAWEPPVLRTVATAGTGVPELVEAVNRFREVAEGTLAGRRRDRATFRLNEALRRQFFDRLLSVLGADERDATVELIRAREIDPHAAAAALVARAFAPGVDAVETAPATVVLDHVAVAVRDASGILTFLEGAFGATAGQPEDVLSDRVRVRFIEFVGAGAVRLELVEPTGADSGVARFLETRGPGLHHIAFRVRDLPGRLASLKARGVRLIDETPRTGAHGRQIAFVHPTSAAGVLVELVAEESLRRADR